jgi:hypothetical protein
MSFSRGTGSRAATADDIRTGLSLSVRFPCGPEREGIGASFE